MTEKASITTFVAEKLLILET